MKGEEDLARLEHLEPELTVLHRLELRAGGGYDKGDIWRARE